MKGVSVQLFDNTGAAYASGTNIAVMWFDSELPPDLGMIKGQSAIATTDASGYLSLDLDDVTGLAVGEFGFLVCYKLDGGDHRASPTFCSKMEVTSMTGVTKLGPLTDYVRNPDWPAQVATVNGVQKFTGLLAVFDHSSNFVALEASGNYTVNWGDGGGDFNVTGGVQAERNISYSSVGGTIVGTSKAVAVTFTDTGDTVNRTAHGYRNGQRVNFATIVSTTGISTHTTYFVVNRTADTFQVSATSGGSALPLTTNGSGTVYIPEYKVALVTVTPQAGQNLTSFSLQKKHTQDTGIGDINIPWLDISINSTLLTTCTIRSLSEIVQFNNLEIFTLGENTITSFSRFLENSYALQVVDLNCASGTDFNYMFGFCKALRSTNYIDTSSGTNFTSMFNGCSVLQSIPRFNTILSSSCNYMFNNCVSLRSVPLLNVAACTNFSAMFQNCTSIQEVPALNTVLGTDFSSMFSGCYTLNTIPLLNTSSGLYFSYMFSECYNLKSIPLLDVSSGTDFSYMFYKCYNLATIPALNTSSGIYFSGMFQACTKLTNVPVLNMPLGGDLSFMFYNCYSLQIAPDIDVSAATTLFGIYGNCWALAKGVMTGTDINIDYSYCRLSSTELNAIYTALATVTSKTITVTGNYGTTGDNPTIATSKGWTVTG